jgi:hypothetical protein
MSAEVFNGYMSDNVAVDQAIAYTAAGTSTITSSAIDMQGFKHLKVIAFIGTPAANNITTVQTGDTTTTAATTATSASASVSVQIIDVQNVNKRYVKISVARGTSSTIEQVTVIRYGALSKAVTQAATTVVAQFNTPS